MSDPLETPTAPGTPDAAGAPFTPGVHQAYRTGRAILKKDGTYVPMKGKTAEAAALAKVAPSPAPVPGPRMGGDADPLGDILGDWPEATQTPENGPQNGPKEGTQDAAGAATAPQDDPTPNSTIGPDAPPPAAAGAESEAAAQITLAAETLAIALLGKDAAMSATDRGVIEHAWAGYFQRHGTPNIPPWGVVVLAHGVWLRAAAQKPTVKGRLATWWGKFAGKLMPGKGGGK